MKTSIDTLLWRVRSEDRGFVVSVELVLVSTIAIIGLIAGFSSVRDATLSELADVAGSIQDLNQCYTFNGIVGHSSTSQGSDFRDTLDFCDDADDPAGGADNCITFVPAESEAGGDGGGGEVGGVTTTEYDNSDNTTDISASQNSDTLKWELEPGQEEDADSVTQAIIDCIEAGHVAEITWSDNDGNTFTFSADGILADGPEAFGFSGSNDGPNGNGKVRSVTVTCSDE